MIKKYREAFNSQFKSNHYNDLIDSVGRAVNYFPPFKICETPVFIPKSFQKQLLEASHEILNTIDSDSFKKGTEGVLDHPHMKMPPYEKPCRFVQLDFGMCEEDGVIVPRLIEMQGFPSLYFYQDLLGEVYQKHYDLSPNLTIHPEGHSQEAYYQLLKDEIVGDVPPNQVIILETEPENQPTRVDFLCAEKLLGIKELCISDLLKEGKELFYIDDKGHKIKVLRIFNRVIFDELTKRTDIVRQFKFSHEVDVEWIGHPSWFFRVSKYALPLLESKFVPKSYYLHQLEEYPEDLENFVLKPLYSFAGTGVILDVNKELLDSIDDPEDFILQRKVNYKAIIPTLDTPAKCELRMMCIRNGTTGKFEVACNLARLTKGAMIGVKYNKNKTWVGGSVAFFEK